jgi:hypothetical protein
MKNLRWMVVNIAIHFIVIFIGATVVSTLGLLIFGLFSHNVVDAVITDASYWIVVLAVSVTFTPIIIACGSGPNGRRGLDG